jgi:hypothetical protein
MLSVAYDQQTRDYQSYMAAANAQCLPHALSLNVDEGRSSLEGEPC